MPTELIQLITPVTIPHIMADITQPIMVDTVDTMVATGTGTAIIMVAAAIMVMVGMMATGVTAVIGGDKPDNPKAGRPARLFLYYLSRTAYMKLAGRD